jgi:hypothetical protein
VQQHYKHVTTRKQESCKCTLRCCQIDSQCIWFHTISPLMRVQATRVPVWKPPTPCLETSQLLRQQQLTTHLSTHHGQHSHCTVPLA